MQSSAPKSTDGRRERHEISSLNRNTPIPGPAKTGKLDAISQIRRDYFVFCGSERDQPSLHTGTVGPRPAEAGHSPPFLIAYRSNFVTRRQRRRRLACPAGSTASDKRRPKHTPPPETSLSPRRHSWSTHKTASVAGASVLPSKPWRLPRLSRSSDNTQHVEPSARGTRQPHR